MTTKTRYHLTLDGINWREINREQFRRLMPMIVKLHTTFITMRTFQLDACLADSNAVGEPQLRILHA